MEVCSASLEILNAPCLLAELPAIFQLSWWIAIGKMILGLGAVIFVHELGHFAVAKLCGVKCEKFYLGFDAFDLRLFGILLIPRALLKFTYGETEYGIGILPLGGYVKMLGQDDNPARAAEERRRSMVAHSDGGEAPSPGSADDFKLDPRSYQAKSVLQRIMIISAGVIMNLIFAVIFAAIAYGWGANYHPAVIGSVLPGSPAWVHNIHSGDTVVEVAGRRREHLRFREDVQMKIALNGTKRPIQLTLKPHGSETERKVQLTPRTDLVDIKGARLGQVGIQAAPEPRLADKKPVLTGSAADRPLTSERFEPGDRILAMNEQPITASRDIYEFVANHFDETISYKVQRQPKSENDAPVYATVVVGTSPLKTFGMVMEYGPIVAIQEESPAVDAGLKIGDQLIGLEGKPIGDPLTLSQRLRILARSRKSCALTIERDGTKVDIQVQPRLPTSIQTFSEISPIGIEELGIAFVVKSSIAGIEPGSPAELAGLQPGDQVISIKFVAEKEIPEEEQFLKYDMEIPFKDNPNIWPAIVNTAQRMFSSDAMQINLLRNGELLKVTLKPVESSTYFSESRGILLAEMRRTHAASSLAEAIQLGIRQTWEDATMVYQFLYKLINQDVSVINLGGPASIVTGATHEAKEGTPRLLLFLTMLSANLAVVNFLPIPVLDGGHMVFLLYELIVRKPVSEKLQIILSFAGLIFLVGLMLFVTTLDLWRFLPWF